MKNIFHYRDWDFYVFTQSYLRITAIPGQPGRELPTSGNLISVEVEKLDGIAGQYCVALLFRHPDKLLIHQLS